MEEDSYLEYVPDQVIPYAGSRFSQSTEITMHETATLVYAESVASGRVGMGESFAYESCRFRMRVEDGQGRLRFFDAADMGPCGAAGRPGIRSFGVMDGYVVASSVYVLADRQRVPDLQGVMEAVLPQPPPARAGGGAPEPPAVFGGATIMPGGIGVLVRLLGHDAESVKGAISRLAARVRGVVLDAPFTTVRKS